MAMKNKIEESSRFSFNLFITGLVKNIMSPRTWSWAVASGFTVWMCYRDGDHSWLNTLIIVWGVISVFFIGGKAFQDALNHMVKERMDVDIAIKKD